MERREGDTRPLVHGRRIQLRFTPEKHQPFRWLSRHGKPSCIGEWLAQHSARVIAWLPVYIAVIVSLSLLTQFWRPW